ncbi:MAG: ModD protein [Coriobacteriia bacterium]|nr:ModD protein [Coriobacteriia bacterium]
MGLVRIPQNRIDYFIGEDIPYLDLTSLVLGVGDSPASMEYYTREACVLAGSAVVAHMATTLGCEVVHADADGARLTPGQVFMTVQGTAAALHQLWKVGLNTFDHLSAVATKTRAMVDAVHAVNAHCEVLTTRKSLPGAKDLFTEAIIAGGAFPHRLGLSETVLVFEQHLAFMGGLDGFLAQLPEIRSRCCEKKIFVESTPKQATALAEAGVDGIQLDKATPEVLERLAPKLRAINPRITLIAAGGVNPENAAAYAATGVDGLATTAPFTAKPIDMSVRMMPA